MSESKSTESLIKKWAETQQKLLTNWLDTVRGYGGAPGPELWTKTVEAWQASVKETLDAQARACELIRAPSSAIPTTSLSAISRAGRQQMLRRKAVLDAT